jgi:hypothetical protein
MCIGLDKKSAGRKLNLAPMLRFLKYFRRIFRRKKWHFFAETTAIFAKILS